MLWQNATTGPGLWTDRLVTGGVGRERRERFALDAEATSFVGATFRGGKIVLDRAVDWSEGTRLEVHPAALTANGPKLDGHVIIVGFGLAGRCVADLLDHAGLPYTILEKNQVTVDTQRALGRRAVVGAAADSRSLLEAGLTTAAILALTIPDEEAVLLATSIARRLRPEVYIIARTNYSSKGMQASQLGADDVIKAEQAVAIQFYERLSRKLSQHPVATVGASGT